jgi:peptidoglycan/LPS O-acetylase OafA/YrhL
LSNRWIATIGGMCYSIYLVHYPIFVLLGRHLPVEDLQPDLAFAVTCALLLPIGLLASAVFFVLVERPCMDPAWPEHARARVRRAIRARPATDAAVVVIPDLEDVGAAT